MRGKARFTKNEIIRHSDFGVGIVLNLVKNTDCKKYQVYFLSPHKDLNNLRKKVPDNHGAICDDVCMTSVYRMHVVMQDKEGTLSGSFAGVLKTMTDVEVEEFFELTMEKVSRKIKEANERKVKNALRYNKMKKPKTQKSVSNKKETKVSKLGFILSQI